LLHTLHTAFTWSKTENPPEGFYGTFRRLFLDVAIRHRLADLAKVEAHFQSSAYASRYSDKSSSAAISFVQSGE
jgi:hypothetical protein